MAMSASPAARNDGAASFEENMTAFYMAFAEQALEPMCQAMSNMRLVVQSDRTDRATSAPHEQQDADVREERLHVHYAQQMLRACEAKAQAMQSTAVDQLTAACAASSADIDAVLTAFFLCAELGAEAQAVEPFASCIARVFEAQARACFDRVCALKRAASVNANGYIDRGFYVEAVSELLTGATDVMNAVADATRDNATLVRVLAPIHATSSELMLEVVRMYEVDARVTAWERRALAQARRAPNTASDVEADESLQMVDLFLDEATFLLRVIGGYSAFLPTLCTGLDDARDSRFSVKAQELRGVYLVLERFYVFQSVHKATAIAEAQTLAPGVYVSSIVEDVSFVLNKAFARASQCMNYHTALSVVIAIVDALESMYLPSILELPKRDFVLPLPSAAAAASGTNQLADTTAGTGTGAAANDRSDRSATPALDVSFSDMLLQAVDDDLTRTAQDEAKLIMAINSACVSGEFVERLAAKIEAFSTAAFPQDANIVECLPKPISDLTDVFTDVVQTEIREMLARGVSPRLAQRVQTLVAEQLQYVLTPAQYDACGLHGSPLDRFLERDVMANRELRRFERALCVAPFEQLVELVVADLTAALARSLLAARTPFNDLGALQLEREATAMLARLSTFAPHASLRASFTRLFQLVLLLNLLAPMDVVDYVASVAQALSIDEIEVLLRMRVDFATDDVVSAVAAVRNALAQQQQQQ